MRHKVTLIPGEGIGPEVAAATRRILEAAGVQIDWEELEGRTDKTTERGQLVSQLAVESVRKNHVALKGPMATASRAAHPASMWRCGKRSISTRISGPVKIYPE